MTRGKMLLADVIMYSATFTTLYAAGAGLWALTIVPYGLWKYWEGQVSK